MGNLARESGESGIKMRVLLVSDRYPPHGLGGYETAADGAARALRGAGHEVRVLTSVFGVGRKRREPGVLRVLHRPMDSASLLRQAIWELGDLAEVRTCLREYAPDVVYAFNLVQLFPSVHAVLSEGPHDLIYEFQDALSLVAHVEQAKERAATWTRTGRGLRGRLRRALPSMLHRLDPSWNFAPTLQNLRLDRAVFCSESVLRRCMTAGLPVSDAAVIYNPVDTAIFRAPRSPSTGPLRVLFVGRLVAEKGAAEVLEACRLLAISGRDVRLTLAGPTVFPASYTEELIHASRAPELIGRVHFAGNVPHPGIPAVYAAHDVLVFPSIALEGMPMTLLEAMAAGLPIISTLTGGSAEILEPETSCLPLSVPLRPAEIAEQLERLARDPELGQRLAVEGRRFVETHCLPGDIAARTAAFFVQTRSSRKEPVGTGAILPR